MAIYRWRGTSSTAWETSANWVNEAGSAYSSGYPGSGNDYEDDVWFDASVTNAPVGYDATAKAVLKSFRVSSVYNGDIGTEQTTPVWVKIKCQDVVIDGALADNLYIYGATSGGWTDGITTCTVLDGAKVHLDGTIQTLTCLKGIIDLQTTSTIGTALTIGYTTNTTSDVTLTIPAVTALPSTVSVSGGTTTCSKAVTTLNLTEGMWTQSTGDLTTVNMQSGTMYWNAGNITTLNQYGGTVTASGGVTARRITTANIYPTAILNLDNGQNNIRVTNYISRFGGTINYAPAFKESGYATKIYAGTSDAKLGLSPQAVNNTNVDSDTIYLNQYDRLDIYVTCGDLPAGSAITFLAKESATSGGSYSNISGKSATFADTDDNKTKLITVWGYELTAGKPWVKVNAANSAATAAYISTVFVKNSF